MSSIPSSQHVTQFVQWATKHDVAFPNLGFDDLPCCGRSVVATTAIAAGTVVVTVPDDAVLLVDNCCIAEELEEAGLSHGECSALIEGYALALALLAERAAGPTSRWRGYIEALPAALPGLPVNWDPDELDALSGTSVLQHLQGAHLLPDCEDVQRCEPPCGFDLLWQQVVQPFVAEHHAALGLPANQPHAWRAAYAWALSIVSAYAFTLGDDQFQGLVAMWDMLNHVTGKVNVRLHHDQAAGALQMIATRDIAAGEHVINNFGPLSPPELLLHYGFIEVNGVVNPHNHTDLALSDLFDAAHAKAGKGGAPTDGEEQPWADVARKRFRFLVKHKFVQPNGCCRVVREAHASMQQLLECARVVCLSSTDMSELSSRVKSWHAPKPLPVCGKVPCAALALAVARRAVQRRVEALQGPRVRGFEKDDQGGAEIHRGKAEGLVASQGLSAAARAAAAAVVVRHERLLLEPLHALLQGLDEGAAAAACEAAWVARL